MIKRAIIILTVLVMSLLSACSFFAPNFTGTIEEINGDIALVKIEEGEILASGDKASVDLSVVRRHNFEVGDKVVVEYGYVGESYPLTIDTIFIKKAK